MNSRQQLIADAEAAGLPVVQQTGRTVIKQGQRDGVIVWADGRITRLHLVNSSTFSATQARQVLKLAA